MEKTITAEETNETKSIKNMEYFIETMNGLHPFTKFVGDDRHSKTIKTNLLIYQFVDEFINKTDDENQIEDISVRATEKLLLRACILCLIEIGNEEALNFTGVCKLLRANDFYEEKSYKTSKLDLIFKELMSNRIYVNSSKTNETKRNFIYSSTAYSQYCDAKVNSKSKFNDAVVSLLNRLTILEFLEEQEKMKLDNVDTIDLHNRVNTIKQTKDNNFDFFSY